MAKFVICFVLALCLFQGSVSATLETKQVNNFEESYVKVVTRGLGDILKFFQDLVENIKNIIQLITHLPTTPQELLEKINEIISQININRVVTQLEKEVVQIIDDAGRDGEKCRPEAEDLIQNLSTIAQKNSSICIDSAKADVDEIQNKVESTVEEAKQLIDEINNMIKTCIKDNGLNILGLIECLKGKTDEVKEKVDALTQKATTTLEDIKQEALQLTQDLAKCMNTVQIKTVRQGQDVISKVELCIRFSKYRQLKH